MTTSAAAPAPSAPAPAAGDGPGTVAVPLSYDAARNEIPGVDVAVAGTVMHVKVDTGSTGLRIHAAKVPAAVEMLGPAAPATFASGARITGTLAEADIGVGPVHSVGATRFEVIQASGCVADHPNCPRPDGRFDGILGLGAHPAPDLDNPLWSLGPMGRAFSIGLDPAGGGRLVLGTPPGGFDLIPLTPPAPGSRPTGVTGAPNWKAAVPVCFDAAALAVAGVCGPTVFDTGAGPVAIVHRAEGPARAPAAGFPITLSTTDGRWSHTYTTAPGRSASLVADPSGADPPTSLVGRPVFTQAEIRIDLAAGTFGIGPRR